MNLRKLIPHLHWWSGTRHNKWMIATEERCTICLEYRHHLYEDRFGKDAVPGKYRKGRFPAETTEETGTDHAFDNKDMIMQIALIFLLPVGAISLFGTVIILLAFLGRAGRSFGA